MPINFPVSIKTLKMSPGMNQHVFYPKVSNMHNKQLQHFINRTIAKETKQLIKVQTEKMASSVVEILGHYEVNNNQRNVFKKGRFSCFGLQENRPLHYLPTKIATASSSTMTLTKIIASFVEV